VYVCVNFSLLIVALIEFLKYYQRIFVLDGQIKHLDKKSLQSLGQWLLRRWLHCQHKREAAQMELDKIDVPEDVLREEWAAQLREQTKLAPRMVSF